jgi:hypothetical protein
MKLMNPIFDASIVKNPDIARSSSGEGKEKHNKY